MCEEFVSPWKGSWPSLYHVVWLKKLSGPVQKKRNFFFTDTASVHTYPMKTINENGTFRKRSPEWNVLKTLFSRVRVDKRKRNFSKTLRTKYQFQSTPHNIRNLLKVAEGRFPFLSFIIGLISNLITCFQANLAFLILQADYSRRRQNIIRLLSLPVSRGGRLDLPLVWLCFCPDFDILNCFCDFKERYNNINPHQRNSKVASIYYFAGS